jgi:hypothetical protein
LKSPSHKIFHTSYIFTFCFESSFVVFADGKLPKAINFYLGSTCNFNLMSSTGKSFHWFTQAKEYPYVVNSVCGYMSVNKACSEQNMIWKTTSSCLAVTQIQINTANKTGIL